ncbi:MAG TPA: LPS assembly lipoprotein LptE [Nitrospiraceae bacterium]|nr:LPS assembly lipoprotein LptE [Nitrospiraceae bacterium]
MNSSRLSVFASIRILLIGLITVNCLLITSSCGYQFRVEGKGPVIGGKSGEASAASKGPPPRMVVPNFENKTFEPNLEIKFTNYTRQEFASGGGVQIVNSPQAADLILKGQIMGVFMPSVSFNQETTFESRVTVTVKTTVEDARTKQPVWTDTATASSEFFITSDIQLNRVLQSRALEQAGRYIAGDVATRFLAHLDAGGSVTSEKPTPPKKSDSQPTK